MHARRRRSLLFVPGTRDDRFPKAFAAGADSVCLDLEDGVAPEQKDAARQAVVDFLAGGSRLEETCEKVVRINPPSSERGRADLRALAGLAAIDAPDAIMVPKPRSAEDLETVADILQASTPALLPLIETPRALVRVHDIAAAVGESGALLFGGMDLAAELGAAFAWEPLLFARSQIVLSAALAGVDAIDVPSPVLDDDTAVGAEARRAASLGFGGKMAIHPRQVPLINQAFTPLPHQTERARRIVDAAEATTDGVFALDGSMVDRPIVEAARRTLVRAGLGGRPA